MAMLKEAHGAALEAGTAEAGRTRYLDLSVGRVEVVTGSVLQGRRGEEGFSPEFQVALPFRGMFVWHVARDEVVGDANQVLFVAGGEAYRISAPLPAAYQELILTPPPSVLAAIVGARAGSLGAHPLFRQRRRRADSRVQAIRARFLAWLTGPGEKDELSADETVLALLRVTLACDDDREPPAPSTMRLIRRTKEFLEGHLSNPIRLGDAAAAVGASSAYLTHVFTRYEGISLHQYLTSLRLARALAELPHAADLTSLALEVGFSSHSHFTAAFRRAYGLPPSQFRELSAPKRRLGLRRTLPARANGRVSAELGG